MADYLMAVDEGTGSVRAVIFDTDGNQLGCGQREWSHRADPRYPGSMDFDWTTNWALACACIREAFDRTGIKPENVAAVSTTCMREGIVLYDGSGREIWACANVDSRSGDEVGELKRLYPGLEEELYMESGQTFALGALPRLLWVKSKTPELYERTARIGMFNDWLIYRLSGTLAVEPSNGSTTGLFDLKTRRWDRSIAKRCGLRDDIFPDAVECGTAVAKVSAAAAAETGLAAGTPLVTGGGDCQLGTIGVGVTGVNEAAVFGGSFWQYEFNTDAGKPSPKYDVRVNCHALPSLWQYEALAFNPGLVMRWYRDGFCEEEKRRAAERGCDPYALLDSEAERIPAGSHGLICAFSDVMNYIAWRHASPSFLNFALDAEKFNRFTFYRAIMENAALVTLGHVDLVERAIGGRPDSVVFAGGAAKSGLWAQILSDVLGIPVRVPIVKEATALGAAILAGFGVGLFNDIKTSARKLVKIEREFTPNAENRAVYADAEATWRKAYAAQLELSDRGVTKYMWRAPGL
ncbi:MAG: autoinducer-2 kinase [Spirochaetaceae bacterium]|jgi:autoinducer 2 (AI-2) kinase|nr:autoinducer-2 kinase [Spirochaetaceae bacterium]